MIVQYFRSCRQLSSPATFCKANVTNSNTQIYSNIKLKRTKVNLLSKYIIPGHEVLIRIENQWTVIQNPMTLLKKSCIRPWKMQLRECLRHCAYFLFSLYYLCILITHIWNYGLRADIYLWTYDIRYSKLKISILVLLICHTTMVLFKCYLHVSSNVFIIFE